MDADENNYIYDGRLVPVFNTLDERTENKILNCLIDFWYYYSIMSVDMGELNENKVFQYFVEHIKKPNSIQEMLIDINISIDAIEYIRLYYKDIVKIKETIEDTEFYPFIDLKKEYKREHYKKIMMELLEENQEKEEVKLIIKYLNKHNMTLSNIPDDYIRRIEDKVYAAI